MGKKLVVFEIVVGVVLLAVLCIVVTIKFGKGGNSTSAGGNSKQDSYEAGEMPDRVDAQKFYEEAGTVEKVIKVSESKTNLTEKEVYELLAERGFTDVSITSSYNSNCEYHDAEVVSEFGNETHPEYSAFYIIEDELVWSIRVINGKLMALPAYLNMSEDSTVEIYVSENENIMGFDSDSRKFYEVKPKKDVAKVVVVDKIDKATLDKLTEEELAK